jgi:hypothetical protein
MRSIKIILKILILIMIFQQVIFINTSKAAFWSDIFEDGDDFIKKGASAAQHDQSANDQDIKDIINEIYSILLPLGVVVTVIVGGVLGIKFMLSSAEDKAKVKESMVPYVIGCVVIYGAFGIWKMVINILSVLD